MKIVFNLDVLKCSACGACAIACMDQNDIDIKNGQMPFRVVVDYEDREGKEIRYTYASISCMHCNDAPCVRSCPTGCIIKDAATGLTVYDHTKCVGCHSCAMACPYGVPTFGMDGKMQKCDGCFERIKHGMEPACCRACPVGALTCNILRNSDMVKKSEKVYSSYEYVESE
ncbi:MAG: 4Fe-4S dicluster domain-containing protein [Dehalobacterium sp.]